MPQKYRFRAHDVSRGSRNRLQTTIKIGQFVHSHFGDQPWPGNVQLTGHGGNTTTAVAAGFTGPDPGHSQLSDTDTNSPELSESPDLPLHSATTSLDNMTMTSHDSHYNLVEHHSHWQEPEGTTVPDEVMSDVDRLSPLPHLNHAAMWGNSHSPRTTGTFVIVNGMTVIPDEVDATVDELEDWDWCDVSHAVVAAAAATSQLEHDDDGAAVSEADSGSESLVTMMDNYIDWLDKDSE